MSHSSGIGSCIRRAWPHPIARQLRSGCEVMLQGSSAFVARTTTKATALARLTQFPRNAPGRARIHMGCVRDGLPGVSLLPAGSGFFAFDDWVQQRTFRALPLASFTTELRVPTQRALALFRVSRARVFDEPILQRTHVRQRFFCRSGLPTLIVYVYDRAGARMATLESCGAQHPGCEG